jgi:transcriptional regulator with XRE-family HTH domain
VNSSTSTDVPQSQRARSPSPAPDRLLSPQSLARLVRRLRAERGWNRDQLARATGLSRTTLTHLEQGAIARPQVRTLQQLATAFEQPLELFERPSFPRRFSESSTTGEGADWSQPAGQRSRVDQASNPAVETTRATNPDLFADWEASHWEQLYATFGVGGALSEAGVRETAARINQGRDLTRKLLVLLETHLGDAAAAMLDSLYDMVSVVQPDQGDESVATETERAPGTKERQFSSR